MSEEEKSLPNLTLEAYIEGLISGEFDNKTRDQVAQQVGVTRQTLWAWDKKLNWDEVKEERRKRYSRHTVEIDAALAKKAKAGDVRAAEIYYQRFDGWIPARGSVNLNDVPDDELRKRVVELREQINSQLAARGRVEPLGDGQAGTA